MKVPISDIRRVNIASFLSFILKRCRGNVGVAIASKANPWCHDIKRRRHFVTSSGGNQFEKREEKNLFEEELKNVYKQFTIQRNNNNESKCEEILIVCDDELSENKKCIGDVVRMDDNTYGVVLQLNKNNTIIGKIRGNMDQGEKYNNGNIAHVGEEKNVYSPFEYLNYLYLLRKEKLNIFSHKSEEMYDKKVIKKQLYINHLLIDMFSKINHGQKVCVIGNKDEGKKNLLTSILCENLLVNLVKNKENFFILCSYIHNSEIVNILENLHEQFRNILICSGEKIGHSEEEKEKYEMDKLYSKKYTYENVQIPNDLLLINSTPQMDSKVATYISPILSLHKLNDYKQIYKNVILILYNVTNYSETVWQLQREMSSFVKNYYHKNEEIIWTNEAKYTLLSALPFSVYTVISKYLSFAAYPHFAQDCDVHSKQGKHQLCVTHTDERDNSRCSYGFTTWKFSDLPYVQEQLRREYTTSSVTSFLFFDHVKGQEKCPIQSYALSLSENCIYLMKNNLGIHSEVNIKHVINNEIVEENKIWECTKNEIKKVIHKRNSLQALIENKKIMNIYIDHWEMEDFIHYNNIYYILMNTNFETLYFNTFQRIVFLRNLLTFNFTNDIITQKHINYYHMQFISYYMDNMKYFSFLEAEFFKKFQLLNQMEYALLFLRKIDAVLKHIKSPFTYVS
ncbi:conserved Plasmodium protein, unknown function [Plasmodium ovale]|uniref:Uncharacterized protein n=1 Tax=Plasmodium ovale TaxID=36330 RepID=A0A1D3TK98_PLAOA|nr:conserved Plasmodium protein, unknown function [Plasmodium ovale]